MSEFQFGSAEMLHGLWLVPSLAALAVMAARRRRRALHAFVEAGLLPRLGGAVPPDPARRVLKCALVLLAVACLVVALARPAWDSVQEEVSRRGRDVAFVLDVSRSMLAEDLPPSRLERAKLAIRDVVDRLEGDRVALAVFSGSTVVKCPLTLDYTFFRMALEDVSVLSVTRGGTLIGDAIRTVLDDVFDAKRSNFRDIVLITDGEDHESFPVEAAAAAGELGVRLIAIGLGDERVGQRIPVGLDRAPAPTAADGSRAFLQYQGREVWSKLDAEALRRMADATPGGLYLNVATGSVDLGEVYRRLIASAESTELGTDTVDRRAERFQLFLALCLLCLSLETGLSERVRKAGGGWAFALACWAAFPPPASAASVRSLVNEGNQAYRAEEYGSALQSYEQALEKDPGSPHAALNRANALYRSGDYEAAASAYSEAVRSSLDRGVAGLRAAGLHNLGNALYRQAEEAAASDPRKAIELLVPAARSYLDALRADRGRADSAQNLELARLFLRRLREQASQQPQAGQSGGEGPESRQGGQDRSQQLQQAAEEQERLADQSEGLERDRRERADADSRQQQERQAQDLADQQEQLRQRTQELAAGADERTRREIEDAEGQQRQAQQDLEQDRPGEAGDAQRAAADALRRAAAEERDDGQQSPQQAAGKTDEGAQAPEDPLDARPMTMQQILAKEQRDRQRRQLQQRAGVVAVEKDW